MNVNILQTCIINYIYKLYHTWLSLVLQNIAYLSRIYLTQEIMFTTDGLYQR